ncbi:GGDEF domain-containing protein [Rhizobium straminoryzae]|uniref:diguanylate cyclase n=2 Tax=Rhizobium straminoryzae TaxID=1387186 RepID=A0A549TBA2_9HYPH|nr:GGDEF domain-containing protein [Rhizobium straminoryzae]
MWQSTGTATPPNVIPSPALLNRGGFVHAVSAFHGSHLLPEVMLLCDIDCFKAINHRSGRRTDDHVLVAVARELTGTIDGRKRIGRFGGEQLMVFVADVTKSDAAGATETRRRRLHWHGWQQNERIHRVTVRFCVCLVPVAREISPVV